MKTPTWLRAQGIGMCLETGLLRLITSESLGTYSKTPFGANWARDEDDLLVELRDGPGTHPRWDPDKVRKIRATGRPLFLTGFEADIVAAMQRFRMQLCQVISALRPGQLA